jgi:hypothetical protein
LIQWSGTPSTDNVLTEDNRPATINNNQRTRLHLDARRRTTFTVQPLLKGSVDQERLRIHNICFTLRTLRKVSVPKKPYSKFHRTISSFFAAGLPKEGEQTVQGHCYYHIALDEPTQSKAKGDFNKKTTTTINEDNNASRHKNLHPQKGHHPATSSGDNHHLCHTKAR